MQQHIDSWIIIQKSEWSRDSHTHTYTYTYTYIHTCTETHPDWRDLESKNFMCCVQHFLVLSRQKSWNKILTSISWTFLVVQWLRIRLPMHGTWVQALVWEDPTCHGATKPVCHNYWACTLEPTSHNYWTHVPQLLKPVRLEPVLRNKEKPSQWEACAPQWRVAPAHRN